MSSASSHRFSRTIAVSLLVVNTLVTCAAMIVSRQIHYWMDGVDWASQIISAAGGMMSVASIAIVSLLVAWGPGRRLVRVLALVGVTCLFATLFVGLEWLLENLTAQYSYMQTGFALRLASNFGNLASLLVPMTMVLAILAAFGRWRIGVPDLGPVQIRILDAMLGTAALAILFVANAEIQHRYFDALFGNSVGMEDFQSVNNQRLQTMTIAAVTAPIAAAVVATAAWCARSRYAWIALLAVLLSLGLVMWLVDPNDEVEIAALVVSVLLGTIWIAINIRLLGRGGWPLSRRSKKRGIEPAVVATEAS